MPIPVKTLLCLSLATNLGLGWAVLRDAPAGTPPAQATPSAPDRSSRATEWHQLSAAMIDSLMQHGDTRLQSIAPSPEKSP